MMTWFDALLVTLWAAVAVLGMRRGLAGGVWGAAVVVAVLLSNLLPWTLALAAALLLGLLASLLAHRVFMAVYPQVWHLGVGLAGGVMVGLVVVSALALSLPIKFLSSQGTYPSSDLPTPLYYATHDSLFVKQLAPVWSGDRALRLLLVPDRLD